MEQRSATFEAIRYADIPGWAADDHAAAFRTFLRSCAPVLEADAAGPTRPHGALAATCRAALEAKPADAAGARAFFETQFIPHRVLHRRSRGLLTGYFEPVLEGSRNPEGRFQVPVYRRPPELVNLVDDTLRGSTGHKLTHARQTARGLEPYYTRAEIESGALRHRGLELVYLADAVDTFFMHIQGSGRIRLSDGTAIRIGYDGKNGHPYTSVGRYLIDRGELAAEDVTLRALAKWLRKDPERGRRVMWQNESFIFFRELEGSEAAAPMGAMKIPLTPGRSLAVDASVHLIGTPVYVVAPELLHGGKQPEAFQRLMIAQDVGSAITGPERGDIYFGSGSAAGRLAGKTKHPGNFIVLLPRGAGSRREAPVAGGPEPR